MRMRISSSYLNITTGSVKLLDDLGLVESEITPGVGLNNLEQYKT